ncbi:MAG: peptidoglycan-binding protein [Actinobacteria bacterium]|nr:peptidoglycan-binding protein [Actinomycetota bacterium]
MSGAPLTEAGVRWLQAKVGTTADGQWGKDTEAAYAAYTAGGQVPGDTGGTVPMPGDTGGTVPIPGDTGGTVPIPGDTGGTVPMLRLGDRGAEVRQLQEKLNGHGAGLDPDSDFGPATDRAVRKFQRATKLEVDGIVGPATWDRLDGEKLAEWPPPGRPDVAYIEEIRQAADETGLPLRHALAVVQGESDFKNIFGCDLGQRDTVPFCRQLVTRERFRELLNHVGKGGTSNGVGLTQVTYGGFLPQLEDAGGGEQPLAQCRMGFRLLKDLFDRHGERKGYAVYNGGPNPPSVSWRYADAMLERARRWREEGF